MPFLPITKLDKVTFYIRNDFSDMVKCNDISSNLKNITNKITHYVDRYDDYAMAYYTNKYMNTNLKNKNKNSPAYIITKEIPHNYIPYL